LDLGQQILRKLATLNVKVDYLILRGVELMADLSALQAQVKANTDVEASAIVLIQGLAAQIAAAGTDPAKLQELQNQLNTSASALAAAITANTPAAG